MLDNFTCIFKQTEKSVSFYLSARVGRHAPEGVQVHSSFIGSDWCPFCRSHCESRGPSTADVQRMDIGVMVTKTSGSQAKKLILFFVFTTINDLSKKHGTNVYLLEIGRLQILFFFFYSFE